LKQYVGQSGTTKTLNYVIGYTHINSDGFSSAYDSSGNQNFDKDGLNQHALTGSFGFKLNKNLQARIFGSYNCYKTALEAGAFTDDKDYSVKNNNVQGGAGLIYTSKKGSLHFNYTFNYVSRDYLDDSTYNSNLTDDYINATYIGRTHFAELYYNRNYGKWQLLTGIDYRLNNTFQKYFSTGIYGPYDPPVLTKKMSQLSPYASLIYKKEKGFNIEFGSRWNHHSEYGNNFTYSVNPYYLINSKEKVFLNLYTAFKSPTLYQLFDPYAGNKYLKPEKGVIAETGTEFFFNKSFRMRIVGFYRNTKNAILYTYNPSAYTNLYLNVSRQENYGIEWESNFKVDKWNFSGNYTFTDGKTKSAYDGTGTPIGKDSSYYNLYRIPKNTFNLSIGLQATRYLFINSQLHAVSKREEFIYGAAPETLNSYMTIDLYSEYKLGKIFNLFINLKNITNKKYFDFLGYNSAKFNFSAGLNFMW
ncbi:MAG TPA: TonB-dependent receptor, partial [Chitinophagaceae bacterium]|nr:TonB-dependent receptor [Chitinophagaceae bacterium]